MTWESIKTAPKDGTWILIWGCPVLYGAVIEVLKGDRSITIGLWDGKAWADETEGWILDPTHWMPLPEPPETEAEGGE